MNRRGIIYGLAGLFLFACIGLMIYAFESNLVDAREAAALPSPSEAPPKTPVPHLTADPIESHRAIAAAMDRKGDWVFSETPLHKVVKSVRSTSGIDVLIDARALQDVGVATDTPVTCHLKNISLRGFLGLVLDELVLAHQTRDGALWITTPEAAEGNLSTRMYPVTDLIRGNDELADSAPGYDWLNNPAEAAYDYDTLIELITTTLAPDSWDEVGGPGAIEGIYGALVISHTDAVHQRVAQFFNAFRQMVRQHNEHPEGPASPIFLGDAASRASIQAALVSQVTCDIQDVPLSEAVKVLAELSGIPIVLDHRSLDEEDIELDVPVRARVKNLPLRFALRRLLDPLDLTWAIEDEVLSITSEATSEFRLAVGLYPVADLVVPYEGASHEEQDFDTLINLMTSTLAPDSWSDVGGPATIESIPVPAALAISQTEANHEKLHALLRELRRAKQIDREARTTPTEGKPHLTIRTYVMQPGYKPQDVLPLIIKLLGDDILDGEGVVMEVLGNDLVIRHNYRGHQRIQGVLSKLGPRLGSGGMGSGGFGGGGGGGGFGGGGMGGGGGGAYGGGGSF